MNKNVLIDSQSQHEEIPLPIRELAQKLHQKGIDPEAGAEMLCALLLQPISRADGGV